MTRGIRNAFRNMIRTSSIVIILGLSLGLSLAMLVAHQAVSDKITAVKASVGNTITIAPAGFNGSSQVNNALTTSQLSKVATLSHVTSLAENLTDRLPTTGSSTPSFGGRNDNSSGSTTSLTSPVQLNLNGGQGGGKVFVGGGGSLPTNFTPPISFAGTTQPSQLNGTDLTISSGQTINGSKDTNNALISSDMASKNNLKVGSTFTAYNTTLTVAGIFKSDNQGVNNNVVVSLPAEQRLSGQSGVITNAVASVDSLDNLSSVTTSVKNMLGSSADVTSAQDQANQTVQPLNSVKTISLYSLIGAVIAGGIIILLTMVMIVRERRREIGVIKAIGASNVKVVGQFMAEAVTFTVMAAVIGIILGVVAGNPITHLLVTNSSSSTTSAAAGPGGGFRSGGGFGGQGGGRGFGAVRNNVSAIHAAVGWSIIFYGLAAALLIAIVGSALASFFIAKIRPAEVMRVE
ncbi:MAG TPA: FtsX-like permease family protein [Candidatus Saccharimonadales bacterium]|nr:FtsX-like permease family protein [Candidatus Saccharimonadales bacterium]